MNYYEGLAFRDTIHFTERISRHISEFACLNVGISLPNHLLGIVEISGSHSVPKCPDENFSHPPATAVWCELVVRRMVDVDLRGFRESLEHRAGAVRSNRRRVDVLIECQ